MAKRTIIEEQSSGIAGKTIGSALFGLGLAVGGFFVISNAIKNSRQNSASQSLQTDPNAQIATTIYNLLKQYGFLDWFYAKDRVGIVEPILAVARSIKDWAAVQKRYRDLYNEDLTALLNNALLPADYTRFLNALRVQGNPTNNTGTGIQVPLTPPSNLTPGRTRIFLTSQNGKYPVKFYKNAADYPTKPYITFPANANFNNNGFIFHSAVEHRYQSGSGTVTATLYQIELSNGTRVWVNRLLNVLRANNPINGIIGTALNGCNCQLLS